MAPDEPAGIGIALGEECDGAADRGGAFEVVFLFLALKRDLEIVVDGDGGVGRAAQAEDGPVCDVGGDDGHGHGDEEAEDPAFEIAPHRCGFFP